MLTRPSTSPVSPSHRAPTTGTGIAPFRSFWRRIFYDGVPHKPFAPGALFWLLSGFANEDSVLYGDELQVSTFLVLLRNSERVFAFSGRSGPGRSAHTPAS